MCPPCELRAEGEPLQKRHKDCAPPSEGAVSVTGRSISRANLHQVAGVPGNAVSTERSQMDYCSLCRRHLNGALMCPGCGASAPDIAPRTPQLHSAAATTATAWEARPWEESPASGSHLGAPHSDAVKPRTGTSEEAVARVSAADSPSGAGRAAPAAQGRAARRRQLALWKKKRRRVTVATAVALVGGGLTVAALPTGSSTRHTSAASAPHPVIPTTVSSTVPDAAQPGTPVTSVTVVTTGARHSGTRPLVTADGGQRNTTIAATASTASSTAGRSRQSDTTVAASPTATTSRPPDTAPMTTGGGTDSGTAGATAPQTTTAATAPAATTAPASPVQVCLLVLCVG